MEKMMMPSKAVFRFVKKTLYVLIKFGEFILLEMTRVLEPHYSKAKRFMVNVLDKMLCLIDKEYPSYAAYGFEDIPLEEEKMQDKRYEEELLSFVAEGLCKIEEQVLMKRERVQKKLDRGLISPLRVEMQKYSIHLGNTNQAKTFYLSVPLKVLNLNGIFAQNTELILLYHSSALDNKHVPLYLLQW
jgi:hypothetical protein